MRYPPPSQLRLMSYAGEPKIETKAKADLISADLVAKHKRKLKLFAKLRKTGFWSQISVLKYPRMAADTIQIQMLMYDSSEEFNTNVFHISSKEAS